MAEKSMSKADMEEIKSFIRTVGEELSSTVATSKMEAIARAHVQEEFKSLGVDIASAEGVRAFQSNMMALSRFDDLSRRVGRTIVLTTAAIITTGTIAMVWQSISKGNGQ